MFLYTLLYNKIYNNKYNWYNAEQIISNFSAYPDSDNPAPQIKKDEDPFFDWFK